MTIRSFRAHRAQVIGRARGLRRVAWTLLGARPILKQNQNFHRQTFELANPAP